jgi:hypothetical protein
LRQNAFCEYKIDIDFKKKNRRQTYERKGGIKESR